ETNAAKLAETEARIAETKSKALASVNDLAADTASAIVERLIGQPVTAEDVHKAMANKSQSTTG
ncbi:MAG: F0F1 ATP synthase subunit B', partial [Hyphomicrobiaceae bacterium]